MLILTDLTRLYLEPARSALFFRRVRVQAPNWTDVGLIVLQIRQRAGGPPAPRAVIKAEVALAAIEGADMWV